MWKLFSRRLKEGAMSWESTALAVLIALIEALKAWIAFTDNDPETVADWNSVATCIQVAAGAVYLLFKREVKPDPEPDPEPDPTPDVMPPLK